MTKWIVAYWGEKPPMRYASFDVESKAHDFAIKCQARDLKTAIYRGTMDDPGPEGTPPNGGKRDE